MATPTWAEAATQLKNAIDVYWDLVNHADGTQLAQFDTLQQALEGDDAVPGWASWLERFRANLSANVGRQMAFDAIYPWLLEAGRLANSPYRGDVAALVQDVREYMIANSYSVATRNITHASPAADGSNTGTGTIHRLTVDEDSLEIEDITVELKTAKCVADGNIDGGLRHGEAFLFYGGDASKDWVGVSGSGEALRATIYASHAGSGRGASLLSNASFDATFGTDDASLTKVPGWTITTDGADIAQVTSDYYRAAPGSSQNYALKFEGNEKITQKLTVAGIKLQQRTPYYLQIAWCRRSTADGTLTIRMGSQTKAVSVNTGTNDVWNILKIDIGSGNWYRNFVEDDCNIEIELSSRTTGSVDVDDVVFVPFTRFDGTWHVVAGAATPFRLDDFFTWTDTGGAASTGKIQYCLWRAGLGYLPHSGAPTITDP